MTEDNIPYSDHFWMSFLSRPEGEKPQVVLGYKTKDGQEFQVRLDRQQYLWSLEGNLDLARRMGHLK